MMTNQKTDEYYVYAYVDPRDESIFYIGKGQGSRSESHIKAHEKKILADAKTLAEEKEAIHEKDNRMDAIKADKQEPQIRILARDLPEAVAFAMESAFIWMYKRTNPTPDKTLTNKIGGKWSERLRKESLINWQAGFDCKNTIHRFTVSDPHHLSWNLAKKQTPYLTAGVTKSAIDAICRLAVDDIVCAYVVGKGFVGVGRVEEEAICVKDPEFIRKHPELKQLWTLEVYPDFYHKTDGKNNYAVKVKWLWVCKDEERYIKVKGDKEASIPSYYRGTALTMTFSKWGKVLEKLETGIEKESGIKLDFKALLENNEEQ